MASTAVHCRPLPTDHPIGYLGGSEANIPILVLDAPRSGDHLGGDVEVVFFSDDLPIAARYLRELIATSEQLLAAVEGRTATAAETVENTTPGAVGR
jgi:hypothetical protein